MNDAAFAEAIGGALQAGRAAWPQVALGDSAFAQWARAARLEIEALVERGAELYLVAACLAQDRRALEAFERHYLSAFTQTAGRVALTPDQADELRQQLRVLLLVGPSPKLATFRGQGPLTAWVQVCAVRLAFRLSAGRERLDAGASLLEGLVVEDADQELLAAKSLYRDAFQSALEECFAALPGRHKTLLRMHFLDGMSIDEMGRVFHVHRATIARWLVAIRKDVLDQVCRKVALNLRTSSSEFRSLVRLVRSDVRLSLGRMLGDESRR
jgi:RNA polymerase sigma-70 factor (ECF subfamily)